MDVFEQSETLKEKAKQVLLNDGHHYSLIICFTPNSQKFIPLSIMSNDEKIKIIAAVKLLMAKFNVWAYVTITEAWAVIGNPNTPVDVYLKPSQSPDKTRALVISVVSAKRKKVWLIPVIEKGGNLSFGKEKILDTQNKGTLDGLFMDLLQVHH